MAKIFKWMGIVLGVLILLVILAIGSVVLFVSPNQLKPLLAEQVKKYTGRQLIMEGDLSWTFFPMLGIKTGHLSLSNPSELNNKIFAEIAHATIGVKIFPLFHHRVESSGMTLDGLKLYLVKNKEGKVNWNFQQQNAEIVKENTAATSGKKAALGLAVSGININNAEISYSDEQTNKNYAIKNFTLNAKDINLFEPFKLNASCDFSATNPVMTGNFSLDGRVALNVASQIYTLRDLNFSIDFKQANKNININLLGDVLINLNQETLQWNNFTGKIANIDMTGNMNVISLITNPVATGHLQFQPFDLRETLKTIGQDVANVQVAKDAKGNADFSASSNGMTVQSNLIVDTIQAAKMKMTNVNVKAIFQNGILNLSPITANLYQGNLAGQTTVNLNNAVPQIALNAKLMNIQAQPLMQDLCNQEQKIKINGVGNFEIQATTSGMESNTLLKNLNGMSQFNFKNGSIVGIDLGYLVDSAYALLKGQASAATNNNQTNFGTLTGTAAIRNGVINNNDLLSDTPRFAIHGAGNIDLLNQKIDYTLQTVIKQRSDQKDNWMNLYGITLPVSITGNLASPSIHLDSAILVKALAAQQMQKTTDQAKEKLQEQLKDKANDLLKGKAGDVLNNLLGN